MKTYYIYIMTNKYRITFYTGVTRNLKARIIQHNERKGSFFTKKYNLKYLVYYEEFNDVKQAIKREKQLKNWKHDWKIELIKKSNPKLETIQI